MQWPVLVPSASLMANVARDHSLNLSRSQWEEQAHDGMATGSRAAAYESIYIIYSRLPVYLLLLCEHSTNSMPRIPVTDNVTDIALSRPGHALPGGLAYVTLHPPLLCRIADLAASF